MSFHVVVKFIIIYAEMLYLSDGLIQRLRSYDLMALYKPVYYYYYYFILFIYF